MDPGDFLALCSLFLGTCPSQACLSAHSPSVTFPSIPFLAFLFCPVYSTVTPKCLCH